MWKSTSVALAAAMTGFVPAVAAPAAATETVLYHFTEATGGNDMINGLVRGKDGVLYGTSFRGGATGNGAAFKLVPPAKGQTGWRFSEIRNFSGSPGLQAALVVDQSGALYGTNATAGSSGGGTVFKLTPPRSGAGAWGETVLHNFSDPSGNDPLGPVTPDGDTGALYGTASLNGPNAGLVGYAGVVFKLTPPAKGKTEWTYTLPYSFSGGADGGLPAAGVIRDGNGNLYGTTQMAGGTNNGVVFKLTPPTASHGWIETVLHSFNGGLDGSEPVAALVRDGTGALYGTTSQGGSANGSGFGIAFKLTPPAKGKTQWTETVLHRFTDMLDGGVPVSALLLDGGALYGTTETGGIVGDGGNSDGNGVLFKLTPPAKGKQAWTETVHHYFGKGAANANDGANPTAGLILDGSGGFFGSTSDGANDNLNGTIYRFSE